MATHRSPRLAQGPQDGVQALTFDLWLLIEVLACLGTLVSMWFYARKSIWGPIIGFWEGVPWVALAVHDQLWALVLLSLALSGISLHAWIKWSRPEKSA